MEPVKYYVTICWSSTLLNFTVIPQTFKMFALKILGKSGTDTVSLKKWKLIERRLRESKARRRDDEEVEDDLIEDDVDVIFKRFLNIYLDWYVDVIKLLKRLMCCLAPVFVGKMREARSQ